MYLLAFVLPAHGELTRVLNTTLSMPQNPATRGYVLQQQFGRTFSAPVALVTPPGETNRLFIVEKVGRISLITNLTAATPTVLTFLNITTKVNPDGEQGLLGLAFHPNYAQNGYFYVFYVTPGTRIRIQADLIDKPDRGDVVKGHMACGRLELQTQSRPEGNEVVTAICIFTLNTQAEFTCCTYSAKVTRPTYHRIKGPSLVR